MLCVAVLCALTSLMGLELAFRWLDNLPDGTTTEHSQVSAEGASHDPLHGRPAPIAGARRAPGPSGQPSGRLPLGVVRAPQAVDGQTLAVEPSRLRVMGQLFDRFGKPAYGRVDLVATTTNGLWRPLVGASTDHKGVFELTLDWSADRVQSVLPGMRLKGEWSESGWLYPGSASVMLDELELEVRRMPVGGASGAGVMDGDSAASMELVPSEPLVLRVEGSGVIRGTLLDPEGLPMEGRQLHVVEAPEDEGVDLSRARASRPSARRWTTDEQGRFEISGLRGGAYALLLHSRGALLPVEPNPIPADGVGRTFTGRLAELRVVTIGAYAPRLHGEPHYGHEWPDLSYLTLRELASPAGTPEGGLPIGDELRRLEDGSLVYEVAPGGTYRVTVRGGMFAPLVREVEIPPGSGRVEVPVALVPARGMGSVEVQIFDDRGERVDELVLAEIVLGGQVVADARAGRGMGLESVWPVVLEVPAGTYGLRVGGQALAGWHEAIHQRRHGEANTEVTVRSGATTVVVVELPSLGGLRVRPLSSDESDTKQWVAIELLGPDGEAVVPRFDEDPYGWLWTGAPPTPTSVLMNAREDVIDGLVPGVYQVRGTLGDGRVAEAVVEVRPGRDVSAELRFTSSE